MCVTVRTLCLLVRSVSVILSVARAVIHDMLHFMVHQGCDPLKIIPQSHSLVIVSVPHLEMVVELGYYSHSYLNEDHVGTGSSTLGPSFRASMGRKKGFTMSGDFSSSRISQLLTRALETLLTKWREETRNT